LNRSLWKKDKLTVKKQKALQIANYAAAALRALRGLEPNK